MTKLLLNDIHALITQGKQPISHMIAKKLIRGGAQVLLTDETITNTEKLSLKSHEIDCFPCQLNDENSVTKLLHESDKRLKMCNTIIHIVPILEEKSFLDISSDEWNAAIHNQLDSTFILNKHTMNGMLASGAGQVIHIYPRRVGALLNETVGTAIHAFSRSIAKEYGRKNIRSNEIIIDASRINEKAYLTEIAKMVSFFLSRYATFISGEMVVI